MHKKENFPLTKNADNMGASLFGTAFLSIAIMVGSSILSTICDDPAIADNGIAFGLVGAAVATIIAFTAFILCGIETKRTPTETPDPNHP